MSSRDHRHLTTDVSTPRSSLIQVCLHTLIVPKSVRFSGLPSFLTSHHDPKTRSGQISIHQSHALLKFSTCIIQNLFTDASRLPLNKPTPHPTSGRFLP